MKKTSFNLRRKISFATHPCGSRRKPAPVITALHGSSLRWSANLSKRVLVLLVLLASAPLLYAPVERMNHGSIGHHDVGAYRPMPMEQHRVAISRGPNVRHEVDIHQHFDVNVDRGRGFRRGLFVGGLVTALPLGYETINVGGVPYYYSDGTYYQPGSSGYVAVAPPVGAAIAALPPDAIPVVYNGQTLYYADGVFYQQDGSNFATVPAPQGVVVPELPPGANQVVLNGAVDYQYNGVYYQPIIVNGVTEYVTVTPP